MTSLFTRRRRDGGEVGRLFDKNSAFVLSVPNDSVPLTGWKLMEQRLQMAQAEPDPNVAYCAQANVEARTACLVSKLLAPLATHRKNGETLRPYASWGKPLRFNNVRWFSLVVLSFPCLSVHSPLGCG